jgi:thymidylate synthase (FAD)
MKVLLASKPQFESTNMSQWLEDRDDSWPGYESDPEWALDDAVNEHGHGAVLCEFAGRLCYDSFSDRGKPDNTRYIKHIIDVGHGSVLEHANYSFLIDGVTRALTHELVRHRAGFAYSQLSTRFADPEKAKMNMVMPPLAEMTGSKPIKEVLTQLHDKSIETYKDLIGLMKDELKDIYKGTALRKAVRQTARYVLSHLVETRLIVTGNARAWRHMIAMRGSVHADTEIRLLAVKIAEILKEESPNLFMDVTIHEQYEDGLPWIELGRPKI